MSAIPHGSGYRSTWNAQAPASELDGVAPSLLDAAQQCQGDPDPMLRAIVEHGAALSDIARGSYIQLWRLLLEIAAIDLVAARTLEPHLDAASILHQAGGELPPGTTWGVFAAEAPAMKLTASSTSHGWELNGEKPWCSLAAKLTHAVVTAHVPDGRQAFRIDLRHRGVEVLPAQWVSRGLSQISSGPMRLDGVPAEPVGGPNWYLERTGFLVGGVGVAACWLGGALGLYRDLVTAAERRKQDQIGQALLGQADRLCSSGGLQLFDAAEAADRSELHARQATAVRSNIAEICERMIQLSAQALGPGPLTSDDEHARRVADLSIYLRQHHGQRDDAALGALILQSARENEVV